MSKTDASSIFVNMKFPEFMNTPAKWNKVVEYIDTPYKFDEIAMKILDDDEIDIFQFRDIIVNLAKEVKCLRPEEGELITLLSDTVVDMLDVVEKKAAERFSLIMEKMAADICGKR